MKQVTDTRQDAIKWWENTLQPDVRLFLMQKYFPNSSSTFDTGVEHIYLSEHPQPTDTVNTGYTGGQWAIRDYEIIGGYGSDKSICEMTGNFMDRAEKKANAQRIVQAVNNHDALVSALKEAMDIIERMDTDINSSPTRTERKRLTDLLNNISNK